MKLLEITSPSRLLRPGSKAIPYKAFGPDGPGSTAL